MSSDLYWGPAPQQPEPRILPRALKYILARRYWDHDGTLCSVPIELDGNNHATVAYVQGLCDAGVEGAVDLQRALDEHDKVLIWIE